MREGGLKTASSRKMPISNIARPARKILKFVYNPYVKIFYKEGGWRKKYLPVKYKPL